MTQPTISNQSSSNIANFLGESSSAVSDAMNLALSGFTDILKTYVSKENSGLGLMKIIDQGGHTGDVIQNFEDLTSKPEKIQLLIKIGSNILEHFGNGQQADLVNSISSKSSIKKTSITSLLNLAGPLVLGQVGKFKNQNNLDSKGIMDLLNANTFVSNNNLPQNEPEAQRPVQEKVKPQTATATVKSKSIDWRIVLPWVILSIMGLFALLNKNENFKKYFDFNKAQNVVKDTLTQISSADFLPDSSNNTRLEPASDGFENEKATKEPEKEPAELSFKSSPDPVATPAKKTNNASTDGKLSADQPAKAIKTEKESQKEASNDESESSTLKNGYTALSSSIFGRNSAEIKNSSGLQKYVGKSVTISPTSSGSLAEDRAYAVRDFLLENGSSDAKVGNKISGSSKSSVAIKIQ
jgi:hypothetical protein